MSFLVREFLKQKRDKKAHRPQDIKKFVEEFLAGKVADYQMSAWLMASLLNGLDENEAAALTMAMLESGYRFDFRHLPEPKVDKHSTGGVGDKTSMILAPIVAATGIRVPMVAGRGLGHTGGTLDKLDAITGFQTRIDKAQFIRNIEEIGLAIMGQTEEICPADKRIYSLRDVTATVESIPLICASIMSKKLAEGIDALVMDVKVGNGAFMKELPQATALAESLAAIAASHQCQFRAVISDMNQVLGRHVGNANEIFECAMILQNDASSIDRYADCRELSLRLASHMIALGKGLSIQAARDVAEEALQSGKAWQRFLDFVKKQGGYYEPQEPQYQEHIYANSSGYLSEFETENIGLAGIHLRAGRQLVTDSIDYRAGIYVHKKIGDTVQAGEKIFSVFAEHEECYPAAMQLLATSYKVSTKAVTPPPLVYQEIYEQGAHR